MDAHTCISTLFSPDHVCPDGPRCPALRLRRPRRLRTGPRQRRPRPRPQEPWFVSTLDLFRADRIHRISTDRPAVLDVGARLSDIRRMTLSHAGLVRACVESGWEVEDLLSEVVCRVHARQAMSSRYDPARAGLGKYLHTITGSILSNLRTLGEHVSVRTVLTPDGETPRSASASGGLGELIVTPAAPVPVQATRVGQVVRRARA